MSLLGGQTPVEQTAKKLKVSLLSAFMAVEITKSTIATAAFSYLVKDFIFTFKFQNTLQAWLISMVGHRKFENMSSV